MKEIPVKKEILDETTKSAIKNMLENFQDRALLEAIENGTIPQNIYEMTSKEIIAWHSNNSDGNDLVESAILTVLEKRHGMGGYESVVTLNQEHIESYLQQIIRIMFGSTCCADKARTVARDLIKSYKQKTPQYERDFGHPIISSKKLWKRIVETSPAVTTTRPIEHSDVLQEFKQLCHHIEDQKEKFLVKFYLELFSDHTLLREGSVSELASDLGIKRAVFPMKEGVNENLALVFGIMAQESFRKKKYNPWNLYKYIHKHCPRSVREIKNRINRAKLKNAAKR